MLKLLKKLDKKEVVLIIVCFIFIIGGVWLDLKLPDYMANITTLVQTENSTISEILEQGVYMLLCATRKFIICLYCWIFCIIYCSFVFKKT